MVNSTKSEKHFAPPVFNYDLTTECDIYIRRNPKCTSRNHAYYSKHTQNANLSNLNLKVYIHIKRCK